jgi:hypothetical protein
MSKTEQLSQEELLNILEERFAKNMHRHKDVEWSAVVQKLQQSSKVLSSLEAMELSGGEPDVILFSPKTISFCDCSKETPKERRSVCFDRAALEKRKEHKPKDDAESMANAMNASILSEEEYHMLQSFDTFDEKTSSWVQTPEPIRNLGGALFCDRRFGRVFTYHNGAESYYAGRGFRVKFDL